MNRKIGVGCNIFELWERKYTVINNYNMEICSHLSAIPQEVYILNFLWKIILELVLILGG